MHTSLSEILSKLKNRFLHHHRVSGHMAGLIRKYRIGTGVQEDISVIVAELFLKLFSIIAFKTPGHNLCTMYQIEKPATCYGFVEPIQELILLHCLNEL